MSETGTDLFTNHPDRKSSVPGEIAVWILIIAELSEFAIFFLLFIIAKAHHPELFSNGPGQLDMFSGLANTFILLTSSYFVAKAVQSIKLGKPDLSQKYILLTLLAGASYCVVKLWEYHINSVRGIGVDTDLFFSVYYYMTFNHLLHVIFGWSGLIWVYIRCRTGAYSAEQHDGLEAGAAYWHMVDLAWIIIFPLLYVMA